MNESYREKNMTTISYAAYDAATQMGTSPGDAAALLLNKVEIRKFKDVLLMFADEDGLKELLIQELCANDAERKKASVYKRYKRDKIEMKVDRVEVSDFPLYLNTVAGRSDCQNQNVSGFSFVVEINAVPVIKIIRQLLDLLGRYGFNAQLGDCL